MRSRKAWPRLVYFLAMAMTRRWRSRGDQSCPLRWKLEPNVSFLSNDPRVRGDFVTLPTSSRAMPQHSQFIRWKPCQWPITVPKTVRCSLLQNSKYWLLDCLCCGVRLAQPARRIVRDARGPSKEIGRAHG